MKLIDFTLYRSIVLRFQIYYALKFPYWKHKTQFPFPRLIHPAAHKKLIRRSSSNIQDTYKFSLSLSFLLRFKRSWALFFFVRLLLEPRSTVFFVCYLFFSPHNGLYKNSGNFYNWRSREKGKRYLFMVTLHIYRINCGERTKRFRFYINTLGNIFLPARFSPLSFSVCIVRAVFLERYGNLHLRNNIADVTISGDKNIAISCKLHVPIITFFERIWFQSLEKPTRSTKKEEERKNDNNIERKQ